VFESFGLMTWRGKVLEMPGAHWHNEIEVNIVETGSMHYLFSAGQYLLPPGCLAIFWGAIPHRMVYCNPRTTCHWMTMISAPDAKLRLHFSAQDVYLVMTSDKPIPVAINLLTSSQKNQGDDLDRSGQIIVSDSRLYHLVQLDSAREGTVELSFTQPGVKVYAFTFGG